MQAAKNTPTITQRALATLIPKTPTPVLPASFPLGRAWFVVAVFGRHERDAAADITALGFDMFCPVQTGVRMIRGRKVECTDPVFPGYLFVHFDRERDEWGSINDIDGVIGILSNGGFPSRVPDIIISRLQNMVAAGVFDSAGEMKAGEVVEITEGPFAGLLAKVKSASPRKRVKVLLDNLGAIDIDCCFLRKR